MNYKIFWILYVISLLLVYIDAVFVFLLHGFTREKVFLYLKNVMAEKLFIVEESDKSVKYETLIPQLKDLITGESDVIANLANITAALKETFGWLWVGFYLVKNNELVLGPFQGPIACTRIGYGKGVCGASWKEAKSILVPDVEKFPGHIACSSESVTEIVVPVFNATGEIVGVLDVDNELFDTLDETDVIYLEKISKIITDNHFNS